ncbi:MAG: hypothetical protein QXR17_02560 [Candidatus Bathyarchaeia archaeon]
MIANIHDYAGRLRRARERLSRLENSSLLLSFIDHLSALGLSVGRVAKYANQLCTLMKNYRSGFFSIFGPFLSNNFLAGAVISFEKCCFA